LGIIQRQTITGSVISYIGVMLGFVTTGLMLPHLFTEAENGVIKLLVANAALFGQLGTVGFTGVISRMFTYFRDRKSNHHGFMRLTIFVSLAGSLLTAVIFYLLRNWLISGSNESDNLMLADYIMLVLPMIFANVFFQSFDNYYKVLFNAVKGSLYREVYQRVFTLLLIIVYFYSGMGFFVFIMLYVAGYALPTLMLLISLYRDGELKLTTDSGFLTPSLQKEMISVSMFNIVIGFSNIAILNIDSLMINKMVGLDDTGIYGITYFFGTLVVIPSRILMKISSAFIAESWKTGNLEQIKDIYYRTSINQFVIGSLIFIGLWGNLPNIFQILPESYEAGRWVILLIALTNLLEMLGGASAVIISVSPRYKALSYMMVMLLLLIVGTNLFFIPLWGITGAAIASLVSYAVYVLVRFVYLYHHHRFQPFTSGHLKVVVAALAACGAQYLLPELPHFILDIFVRSLLMIVVFSALSYGLRVSEEVTSGGRWLLKKAGIRQQ
jgi:O-antigen/teichoic acid export membrane protein